MAYNHYVEKTALFIPTLEPTEYILSTFAPSFTPSICNPIIVERMDFSTIVTASAVASAVATIIVLGASTYCNYLRAYLRHKYLNSIVSDSDSSRGSDSRREDSSSRLDESEESTHSSISSLSESLQLSESSRLERFIWAHFTFDKIYAREDDEDIV